MIAKACTTLSLILVSTQLSIAQAQVAERKEKTVQSTKIQKTETSAKSTTAAGVAAAEYDMVELEPGKSVKKLREPPAAVGSKAKPGAQATTVVGTYNEKHEYSEKTPPAKHGDKFPQTITNPGKINERYVKKGDKLQAPAAGTAVEQTTIEKTTTEKAATNKAGAKANKAVSP